MRLMPSALVAGGAVGKEVRDGLGWDAPSRISAGPDRWVSAALNGRSVSVRTRPARESATWAEVKTDCGRRCA